MIPKVRMSSRRKTTTVDAEPFTTKKQIDTLSEDAQDIFKKVRAKAMKQYQKPAKRMGGKRQIAEVAQLTSWIPAKHRFIKQGDQWVKR